MAKLSRQMPEKLAYSTLHDPEAMNLGSSHPRSLHIPSPGTLIRFILRRTKYAVACFTLFALIGLWNFIPSISDVFNGVFNLVRWNRQNDSRNFVILQAANLGGGVMEWKGAREWAIERDSVKNKRAYAERWGYHLEVLDMRARRRYSHEWREGWEKVDALRRAMRKYPNAQWFWWLDLHTVIMEPSISLQDHIFEHLDTITYRDINKFNPQNISHPFNETYLEPDAKRREGDGKVGSINLIVAQDCNGMSLGSFFLRRSEWTNWLLDIWWDPVAYEQKHMKWDHNEQSALERLYRYHPWIRSRTAFVNLRHINSYPSGACSKTSTSKPNPMFHYNENDRDFLVNMAGCQWGRDCLREMRTFIQLSERLNKPTWKPATGSRTSLDKARSSRQSRGSV